MDNSRDQDLMILHRRLHDLSLPARSRSQARRKLSNIRELLKDKQLTKLRYRLIKAVNAGDNEAADKVEQLIYAHQRLRGRSRDRSGEPSR